MGQPHVKEIAINIAYIFIGFPISPVNLKHSWCRSSQIRRPPARDTFWEVISEDCVFRE